MKISGSPSQLPRLKPCLLLASIVLGWSIAGVAAAADKLLPAVQPAGDFWQDVSATPIVTSDKQAASAKPGATGATRAAVPRRYHAAKLNRQGMQALTAAAPQERSAAAAAAPLVISLPHPEGGYQRFAIVDSPVMEAGLAAKHPEIRTFAGKGIDDPSASLRMDITPLGLHASVRTPKGAWYVDPQAALDDSVYNSYHRRDLPNVHGVLKESALAEPRIVLQRGFYHAADTVRVRGAGFAPGASVSITVRNIETDSAARQSVVVNADEEGVVVATLPADPSGNTGGYEVTASEGGRSGTASYLVVDDAVAAAAETGGHLRSYRLALVTDPSYATYFGGPANVTAAKVSLINRVTQVYEDETSIRLQLINATDALNLDTAAMMTGANGPCGGAACFTPSQATGCSSGTLSRNRIVTGLLAGAGNFDVGHIALGLNGGGIASLGVVGGSAKAQGCTGIPTPVGDVYAVDYVAHELGHQFAGNHTFNGVSGSCSGGNRNEETSVEPGSGSSIMAYAGICGSDNLQPHSDAYWSQRSFDEIVSFTSSGENNLNEVQVVALSGFTSNGRQFQLRFNGGMSAPIVRGSNFTTAGVKAAIQAIPGWPAGATVTASALSDNAFTLTFGGTLAGSNVAALELLNCSGGCSGYVGEVTRGGATTRGGAQSASGNSAPVVTVTPSYVIPLRTPFALSGSASDADGDPLSYLWEQNDAGTGSGTGLINNTKKNGPLFRQFGLRAAVTEDDAIEYHSPGENHTSSNPVRVFPDLAQILANNSNAVTGACPVSATPTLADIDCYSEFLPTASYAGGNGNPAALNFRLTARDGRGGVGSASTRLLLAPGAGPFLVTAPNSAVTLEAGSSQTVSWNVANTSAAPVNAANVRITLSADGGLSFPYTLSDSAPNSGSKTVTLPQLATKLARIKVEALGNVFFDISDANFTIALAGDVDADGAVDCADISIVRGAMGKRGGQAGFNAAADVNHDNVVDVRDLAIVTKHIASGSTCQ
ncbi:hypothetical protein HSX11_21895 [Oxalobacteraceae bacterium]|nr:hypothetical protein [Oxalobacteraceae bacterium]